MNSTVCLARPRVRRLRGRPAAVARAGAPRAGRSSTWAPAPAASRSTSPARATSRRARRRAELLAALASARAAAGVETVVADAAASTSAALRAHLLPMQTVQLLGGVTWRLLVARGAPRPRRAARARARRGAGAFEGRGPLPPPDVPRDGGWLWSSQPVAVHSRPRPAWSSSAHARAVSPSGRAAVGERRDHARAETTPEDRSRRPRAPPPACEPLPGASDRPDRRAHGQRRWSSLKCLNARCASARSTRTS